MMGEGERRSTPHKQRKEEKGKKKWKGRKVFSLLTFFSSSLFPGHETHGKTKM
jgi:hypothetical protein